MSSSSRGSTSFDLERAQSPPRFFLSPSVSLATMAMEPSSAIDAPPRLPSPANASAACEALREFGAHSCLHSDRTPGGGCDGRALGISPAPPPSSEEFAHECVLGFMFADEMKVVRQLQRKHREGELLVQDIYCARSCARAIPPVTQEADPAQTMQYYLAVFTGAQHSQSIWLYF